MKKRLAAATICALLVLLAIGTTAAQATEVGWNVPWAIGGPRVINGVTNPDSTPEWPTFAVKNLRLWDTRTAWLNLEPAQGQYDWSNLDKHIQNARSKGVDHITLVLWGTPNWATSKSSDEAAPWLGKKSASPPDRMQDWLDFVGTVATKYRGVIDAYELGNEPNLQYFWNGTTQQYVAMVDGAARKIKEIDPTVAILAPAPVMTSPAMDAAMQDMWQGFKQKGTPFSGATFHYYPWQLTANGLVRAAAVVKAVTGLPVWATEVDQNGTTVATRKVIEKAANKAGLAGLYWYRWGTD